MENIARLLLKIKKWFGIASTVSWIFFLALVATAIVLVTFGTVFQNMYRNLFENAGGFAATGLPLLWFFATIYYLPVDAPEGDFLQKLATAAGKGLRPVAIFAGGVAAIATVLGLLSEPLVLFGRSLIQDVWPFGKLISKVFSSIWATLMVVCLVVLIRLRSLELAKEVFIELIKESWKEIIDFYVEAYVYIRADKSA